MSSELPAPKDAIAIVGLACLYPDARTPQELWENVLAQRRSFRRLPDVRLRRADYFSPDREAPDQTYAATAAVIVDYSFDRVAFQVVGSTYRSADLAHWVALDVASQALADAGFSAGAGLPRESTGVILGNTLTGEFSRANLLRLRWPYVRRVLEASLTEQDWSAGQRADFLEALEAKYKAPFPPVGEETLAGGLSNTIAGRICNHFNLNGGGHTVDAACASSLLAVAHACSALVAGDLDVALAGGVDLSLDPFEIVGFAKTGALAPEMMRVFDAGSAGFWPGEGCGFVTLMRAADALATGRRIYAVIRGWGVSSDGAGGITRPEVDGQLHALRRAYRRAGYGIDTVGYFEGHGTGTRVGDATELKVLTTARQAAAPGAAPAVLGTIKGNIGHTKAAAGIAGLIKATLAIHTQTLPPTTGCERPHAELTRPDAALRVLSEPEVWDAAGPLRAAVSAMGFGGINAHVTLENPAAATVRRSQLDLRERVLGASAQDCEIFLFAGCGTEDLLAEIGRVQRLADGLSFGELADLAGELARRIVGYDEVGSRPSSRARAAVVASSPTQLAAQLTVLRDGLLDGTTAILDLDSGVFLGLGTTAPRLGFLFPGQGSPTHLSGGIFRRRFPDIRTLYAHADLPAAEAGSATAVAQPAIAVASASGWTLLHGFGLCASVAVGHSLGEIGALHWAGAFDEATLLRVVRERGRAMNELGHATGAMAAIAAPAPAVASRLAGIGVNIVGYNSPRQTVVAGDAAAVAATVAQAQSAGWRATQLPVSHAFHTRHVAAAVPALAAQLARETMTPPRRRMASTVLGTWLDPDADLRELLGRQVTSPVRFSDALQVADPEVDLWIEVGPGEVLYGLVRDSVKTPVVAVDTGSESLRGLWHTVGAAFALGAPVRVANLFTDRITRPFSLDADRDADGLGKSRFFVNPCELAPVPAPDAAAFEAGIAPVIPSGELENPASTAEIAPVVTTAAPLDLIRELVAKRTELPVTSVRRDSRLLSDLHLNSISVGQIMAEAAKRLGLPPLLGLTDFATATVGRAAEALEALGPNPDTPAAPAELVPTGVDSWVRPFSSEWIDTPPPASAPATTLAAAAAPSSTPTHQGWQIFGSPAHPWTGPLIHAFASAPGRGVVVCLSPASDAELISRLLPGAKAALAGGEGKFILVQDGVRAGSFARTLHLEAPYVATLVIEVPRQHPQAVDWIREEAGHLQGHRDVRYLESGGRQELRLKPLFLDPTPGQLPLNASDLLLVTGGGKGIAAECALALGRQSGARLVLLGRSPRGSDAVLEANLARFQAAQVRVHYVAADVTDAEAILSALRRVQAELGPVTAFVHAAGANVPQLIEHLDEISFRQTLAPKVDGVRHVLRALDESRLRLFVTFGSIIGRGGLAGEADYAVPNEWLTQLTEEYQAAHPHCRCLAAEWSVWSGVGMGARLGRLEALRQKGITPIAPEAGVEVLMALLHHPLPATAVVITGRCGRWPTLAWHAGRLPEGRFLQQTRVHYPGVEWIADSVLSSTTDPYVEEHVFHGEPLFPAVMGLEAMAQVAMALAGSAEPPNFENIELTRPVVVPRHGTQTIRVAALVREPGVIEVVLRCGQTGFQADHFRAVCRFAAATPSRDIDETSKYTLSLPPPGTATVRLDPERDLYDRLLFHTGRFRRVKNYRLLRAHECVVQLLPFLGADWFGPGLPQGRVLGCAAVRDAAIHAIQACIPHARLLPIAVRRIVSGPVPCRTGPAPATDCAPELLLHAHQMKRDADTFEYDLELMDGDGRRLETWEGLRLRKVEVLPTAPAWPEGLLAPYLERRLEELLPRENLSLIARSDLSGDGALRQLSGADRPLLHRSDGRPEISGNDSVFRDALSRTHPGVAQPIPGGL